MKHATMPRRGDLLLETHGLVKAYKGRRVVNGVHFQVRAGEIVGLLGPNGAGKTTSFRMTVGLIQPDEGVVHLNGAECSKMPMYRRARLGMGYLPQEPSIFRRMSVKDNLLAVLEAMPYRRRERHREAERLMGELELTRLAKNLAETLSGGERRRLELCRALATKPTILLLDEPFAGVDPINVQEIQGLIEQMREKDLGILITDHNVRETLKSTDRAYIIYEGKILREGTATELIQDERVKEVYLGHSFDAPLTQGVSAAEEREFFEDPPPAGSKGLSKDEQRDIQDDDPPVPSGKRPPKRR
jgi:lipopolysaccharide export system ATP-binding protein